MRRGSKVETTLETIPKTGKQLKVYTLGQFVVKNGETLLSESGGRSRKLWELFKYLLVHNDRVLLPEVIAEQLWPDQNYADAKSAVRTLIHRLRGLLGDGVDMIKFVQGGYTFNRNMDLWLDMAVFEACCRQARQAARQGQTQKAKELYKQGLDLYKGDLLPECAYSDWLIPLRNHYHRLYMQSVLELVQLLRETQSFAEIVEEAAKALLIDYFEEELHIYLLEALLADGKVSQAKGHYENVTAVFYREMGVKPSPAMKRLFRQIQERDDVDGNVLDFTAFREAVDSRLQAGGAFLCEPEFFRFLCQLETRRAQRSGQNGLLLMLTVTAAGTGGMVDDKTQHAATLQEVLQRTLRNSDVFCSLGSQQFIVLLPTTTPQQGQHMLQRLAAVLGDRKLLLKSRLQPLNLAE
jgi:DNA-binding SARP family transcriptional activator